MTVRQLTIQAQLQVDAQFGPLVKRMVEGSTSSANEAARRKQSELWCTARASHRASALAPNCLYSCGSGDPQHLVASSDSDPYTGVCGFAHSAAPKSSADEVPIKLGSISESSDRAGLMR